jgi:hypothetical protein
MPALMWDLARFYPRKSGHGECLVGKLAESWRRNRVGASAHRRWIETIIDVRD